MKTTFKKARKRGFSGQARGVADTVRLLVGGQAAVEQPDKLNNRYLDEYRSTIFYSAMAINDKSASIQVLVVCIVTEFLCKQAKQDSINQ
jgi:hypothetical protein